jgi:hypothetical protein
MRPILIIGAIAALGIVPLHPPKKWIRPSGNNSNSLGFHSAMLSCGGSQSSVPGLAILTDLGSRSVRLSGASGSRSMILGSR